jgi:hypothetical protein
VNKLIKALNVVNQVCILYNFKDLIHGLKCFIIELPVPS